MRLVDDTFFNWLDTPERIQDFLLFVNSLYPPIQWTLEVEENNSFHIFDIQLNKVADNLETSVYRKPSASDRYLHYSSAQALHERVAAIHTLTKRAYEYCNTKALLDSELAHIRDIFLKNGYPDELINNVMNRNSKHWDGPVDIDDIALPIQQQQEPDYSTVFYAPYHPKAAKMFRLLKKNHKIQVVYKKTTTLGNLLSKRRPKVSKFDTSHVCYAVPCMDCEKRYIGHTKRKLRIRLYEHKKSCEGDLSSISPNPNQDNGIPYHHALTGHEFDFDNTKILEHEKNVFRRLALEGMRIQIAKSSDLSVNINSGLKLDNCWIPFLRDLSTLTYTQSAS